MAKKAKKAKKAKSAVKKYCEEDSQGFEEEEEHEYVISP